ncbi:alanine racemase [Gordonia spumicola]|uniref:Alanine racemase n=1 Tax=Gordonia spumicola TaxID=589161 RepID=A0A7I9VBA8_9ACTN|nr:alanine racemase [Gordonia spumicola]GEE02639.1 alanine racemase [Gordonia spumicola]
MSELDLETVTASSGVGYSRLARATADLEPPFAVVDLGALKANADSLVARAGGKPVRLASKSVRCRAISSAVLARPGFRGVLALTLAEALWLASEVEDVVVGYPTADLASLRTLAADPDLLARVTLMVDDVAQLDLIEHATGDGPPIRVCIDLDASLRLLEGRVHLGVRRSPVHSADDAAALARRIVARPRFALVGLMAYEGQIAGVGDNAGSMVNRLQIRGMQMASAMELRRRRAAVVAAVREIADLEFVNGGGTGSIERTVSEPAVTEVAAGSGLYCPTLFDKYRGFRPQPAAFYVQSVVRTPSPEYVTVLGGGWVASGAVGAEKLPTPSWPIDVSLISIEGAGEAQTPLHGPGVAALDVGDRVWFRHAKAGELCERVNELHLVDGDRVIATVPTYRGEGRAFL